MPHSLQAELQRAHSINLKNHMDSVYDKLNALCKELTDMDLQTFHCCHDAVIAEVEGDVAVTDEDTTPIH